MTDQDNADDVSRSSSPSSRVISASRYRSDVLIGPVEIHAYTKHGSTSMFSVMPPEKLEAGEVLKTRDWVLGAKHFVVIGEHAKAMKLPGLWYEVTVVKPT